MLKLVLGGSGSGKTTHLYVQLRARAEAGQPSILLVPEQFTSSTEARLYRALGDERARTFHVHFSRIAYTQGGEKCHLTFADTAYGPPHQPLMALFKARGLCPTVICE